LAFLLLASCGAAAQAPAPGSRNPSDPGFLISVKVDHVVLHATVRDSKARAADGLREQDFAVYEDGVRQSLLVLRHEDIPISLGLVVDHSGSMRGKLAEVVAASRTFVRSSSPEDQMFVVNFNENVSLGLPPKRRLSNQPDELAKAIADTPATGQTALYDALYLAYSGLEAGTREKKALVVISDGGDNASSHTLAEILKLAGQSNAVIYTVGIFADEDADQNPDVLRKLARATGGEAFFPHRMDEIVTICGLIARDLRNQYTLAYNSSNVDAPGTQRSIRVTANSPDRGKLTVRTRTGYIAADKAAK
jgi:VWFA-related protein